MKRIFSVYLLSFFLLSLMVSAGLSQDASDILEKMIEAQGGKKVIENIKDMTSSGTLEMTQMGMSGSMTMYRKEPDKVRMDIEVMGMVITQAFDGETAWWVNPQTGSPEEMSEQQSESMKRMSFGIDALLYPEKYGITYSYKGKEKIDEKEYFVLEQTFPDGFKATIYIDPKTYLSYKSKSTIVNQMGVEVEQETFETDYKNVNGMMIAHSITIFQGGEEYMKINVTEMTFNSGLEDSFFKMSR
jgi:outer membrane lipoprotein-sorting protein